MALGRYEFIVDEQHDGKTLKTFLRQSCGISARSMTVIKYNGGTIKVDNQLLRAHDIIHANDTVVITLPAEHNEITPVEGVFDILYEDDYLLIVNKPADMPVHTTKVHQLDTLANIVSFYRKSRGEDYLFRALNRLDKDTSGCVVLAKDRVAYSLVKPTVSKTYIAICEGIIEKDGVVDTPIALSPESKIKRSISESGAEAVTHYHPISYGNGHTMCKLWLETGRTHQIRCHMSSIGHPLAGDDLYGGSLRLIRRQALHCQTVCLEHPVTHKKIVLTTEIPNAFYKIINEG